MAEYAEIKPAVNQLKTNVLSQQWDAGAEMKPYGMQSRAYQIQQFRVSIMMTRYYTIIDSLR